jgi:hypothetical protein
MLESNSDAELGTNFGMIRMGDVTYRRHGWKIECENWRKFADTLFRGLRFEIRGSKNEGAVPRRVKTAKMNVPVRKLTRGKQQDRRKRGANTGGVKCVW